MDAEKEIVDIGYISAECECNCFTLYLVGSLWTNSPYNLGAFRNTIKQIWRLCQGVEVRDIGKNLFNFQFYHWKDKERVLHGQPWWYDKKVLCLQEISGDEQPSQFKLHFTPFWVRVYDLPFIQRTRKAAEAFGNKMGQFMDWDDTKDSRWGKYLRLIV